MAATTERPSRWYTTRESCKTFIFDVPSITDKDAKVDKLIARASAYIERYTKGRKFIPWTGTKEIDYQQSVKIQLPDDLLSVTTFNADGTTVASSDYFLYPLNAADDDKPYLEIELLFTSAVMAYIDTRQAAIAITGMWGYSNLFHDSLAETAEELDATETDITVDAGNGSNFEIGMTIVIESEQIWVSNIATDTLTVTRGMNGTTAATHATATTISIYRAPGEVIQACETQVAKWLHRADAAFSDRVGARDQGFRYTSGLDREAQEILKPFRRMVRLPGRPMGRRTRIGRYSERFD